MLLPNHKQRPVSSLVGGSRLRSQCLQRRGRLRRPACQQRSQRQGAMPAGARSCSWMRRQDPATLFGVCLNIAWRTPAQLASNTTFCHCTWQVVRMRRSGRFSLRFFEA